MNKDIIIILIVIIVVIGGVWLVFNKAEVKDQSNQNLPVITGEVSKNFEIQGMKIEILKEGSGPEAKNGNTVSVHYTGTLENGTKFDSSLDRGTPFEFNLGEGRVIKGWELGVVGMKVGEQRKLIIPSELAYGDRAVGEIIPANSTLLFTVELLAIE